MAIPSYEMYQLAHIATFIADRLVRRRAASGRRDRPGVREAERHVAAGNWALRTAQGRAGMLAADAPLPRPLDTATFEKASALIGVGERRADVVSLSSVGRPTWAVVGHVPGIGAVGAEVASQELADAIRQHVLTQPAAELAAWAVGQEPHPGSVDSRVDLAAFVEGLDPSRHRDRAVVRQLRGVDRRTDLSIRGRFAGVDLDAPLVVEPPATAPRPAARPSAPVASPAQSAVSRARSGQRQLCGIGVQRTTARPVAAPTRSAGP